MVPFPAARLDLAEGLEAQRLSLLERFPGFRETLMGSAPPAGPAGPVTLRGGGPGEALAEEREVKAFTAENLGSDYEAFLGRAARQSQGTFYTERAMIRRLLAEPLTHPHPRLLDPAMGCGAFLSEALAMRALTSSAARWEFACASLFGVDCDPLAREIALLALWLQVGHLEGDPRRLQRNLRLGNSLLPSESGELGIDWMRDFPEVSREGGFTAVIGNPPFLNVERLAPAQKARYRKAFPSLQKRFDLFVPMAEKALDLTRPGGHVALVLPSAFLTQAYGEPLRRRFLEETTLIRLEETVFPGASVRTVLVTALKTPPPPDHRIDLRPFPEASPPASGHRDVQPQESLPQAPLRNLPEARIPSRGGEAFAIALQTLERGIPLGAVAFATWGARGVPIADFHRDQPDHPSCRPMIKGEGIDPYRLNWAGKWLRYEPSRLYRPLFPQLFEDEKIVLRKVSGSRGLVAALDRDGFYTDDSVLCCQLRSQLANLPPSLARRYGDYAGAKGSPRPDSLDGYDLPILLAMLNSRIGALVFTMLLGNGLNVYPAAVMRMPLPPYDAGRFDAIRALVTRRTAADTAAAVLLDRDIEGNLAALFGLPTPSTSPNPPPSLRRSLTGPAGPMGGYGG